MIPSPSLREITAAVPNCLSPSVINLKVNGHSLSGIIDSANSESFIDGGLTQKLKLRVQPAYHNVTLASSSSKANVVGFCTVDLNIDDHY